MSSKTALLGGTNVSLANPDLEVDGPKFGPRGEQPLALGDFSSFSDIGKKRKRVVFDYTTSNNIFESYNKAIMKWFMLLMV